MKPRKDDREVEVMGAFPGADVVRGKDWNLEDKDGKSSYQQLETLLRYSHNSFLLACVLYHKGNL